MRGYEETVDRRRLERYQVETARGAVDHDAMGQVGGQPVMEADHARSRRIMRVAEVRDIGQHIGDNERRHEWPGGSNDRSTLFASLAWLSRHNDRSISLVRVGGKEYLPCRCTATGACDRQRQRRFARSPEDRRAAFGGARATPVPSQRYWLRLIFGRHWQLAASVCAAGRAAWGAQTGTGIV